MNKSVITVVIVIVLAIGGFFAYRFANEPQTKTPESGDTTQNTNNAAAGLTKGSLASLMAAGKNVTCTFTQTEATGNQQGTVYIAGTMMRGDFITNSSAGAASSMHMIRDNEWQYVWGDTMGGNQGIKLPVQDTAPSNEPAAQENVDLNKEVDFTCAPWSKDDSLLTPPADVTFQTMGTMMPQNTLPDTATPSNAADDSQGAGTQTNPNCAVCNQIPAGASRDQCLQSLGC